MAKRKSGHGGGPQKRTGTGRGRPARGSMRQRKQLVVDVSPLKRAMQVTGQQNQSETVNEALARLTENAAILHAALRSGHPALH